VMASIFAPDAAINLWKIDLVDLGFIRDGLRLRVNLVSIIAAAQKIIGLVCLFPLVLVGLIPIVTGDLPSSHLFPLLPIIRDAAGHVSFGTWDTVGLTLLAGAMFGAGWSTYGFETAVCYTREFKDPKRDTFKAILAAGLLCIVIFTLVPLAFQATLGLGALLDPKIYDGSGVALALARIVHGGVIVTNIFVATLILSLLLIVMTSMMGSSRTLYQASLDGWFPRYLSRVNRHGAPTAAMWTDLGFNLVLLLASDYFAVLMISNVCYFVFNFLNLQSGWIHRIDRGSWERPYRCPTSLLALAGTFGFVNIAFMGAGANVWGAGTLRNGLLAVALIVPVFVFRHYFQDGGRFPASERGGGYDGDERVISRRAGVLPYLALVGFVAVAWVANHLSAVPTR
jgi:amino acid transporter